MKTAIVLYGFMRTFKITANSLLKNIAVPNDADIFIFSYTNEGVSILNKNEDINTQKLQNGTMQDLDGSFINEKILKEIYGERLKKCLLKVYSEHMEKFKLDSKNIYSPILPIERVFSLYFNITGATKLLIDYEIETVIKYDVIILARPDLNFYSQIKIEDYNLDKINIANYGGNINPIGKNEAYHCCFYKNVKRAEYIPFREIIFSDQLIISKRKNMIKLVKLYEKLNEYDTYGLPVCHPETILYYHLCMSEGLNVQTNDIKYEILRNNYIEKTNEIMNLQTNRTIKTNKYKNKLKNDLLNIKQGFKSLGNLPFNFIKYIFKKG